MEIKTFKDLIVWQKSIDLVGKVYKISDGLPLSEEFGITSQIRRAAVAIPSNIAEGNKRGTRKDYVKFLRIADGSSAELETQLFLLKKLYPKIDTTDAEHLLVEIEKMLHVMIEKLSAQPKP